MLSEKAKFVITEEINDYLTKNITRFNRITNKLRQMPEGLRWILLDEPYDVITMTLWSW